MINHEERYRLTDRGIAIHERYTVTLIEAREALEMTNWLLRHYVELHKLAMEQIHCERQEANRGRD